MSVARFGGRGEIIMSSTDGLRILFERLIQQAPAIRDGDAQAIAWLTRDLHDRIRQEPVDDVLSELLGMVGERAQTARVKPTSETLA